MDAGYKLHILKWRFIHAFIIRYLTNLELKLIDWASLQTSESLYDQKPEEPPVQVSSSNPASSAPTGGSSFTSRFEYTDNVQSSEMSSGRVLNHVSPPMSSNFFADYGMESGFTKKSSKSSKVQVSSYSSSYVYCHTRILSFFWERELVNTAIQGF